MAERHPLLLAKLVEHPGVGLLLVRSPERGAMAMGREGSATSTRTASKVSTRRRFSASTP